MNLNFVSYNNISIPSKARATASAKTAYMKFGSPRDDNISLPCTNWKLYYIIFYSFIGCASTGNITFMSKIRSKYDLKKF